MIYGYARVSRKEQNIDRQIRNITAAFPTAHIMQEAYTGTRLEGRKEYEKLCKVVRGGDTVVFDSVSRMSRNAEEGFAEYEKFFKMGVELVFLKEHHIDTVTYKKALTQGVPLTGTNVDFILEGINKYLLSLAREQIILAFAQAEKEVQDLRQRTREGILTAKLNGKRVGTEKGRKLNIKKEAPAKEGIKKYSKDFGGMLSDADVMKIVNLSRNTYYKYKRELLNGEG